MVTASLPAQQADASATVPGTVVSPQAPTTASPAVSSEESPIPNAERLALDLRSIKLDMHLNAETGEVTTRARIHVANRGLSPLPHIALQISSQLTWQSARLLGSNGAGTPLPLQQFHVTTDADHSGAATELTLALQKPLAPGTDADLDLYYGGTIEQSADRLIRLGAPDARAAQADWDTVTNDFIGLRGFGNVLWYPVAAPATLLAQGESFPHATDEQRQRTATTQMQLSLKLEHTGDALGTAWFLDRPAPLQGALKRRDFVMGVGEKAPATLATTSSESDTEPNPDASTIETADWPAMAVDGRPVSLFVARTPEAEGSLAIDSSNGAVRESYAAAAKKVAPFLDRWLPVQGRSPLQLIDLPAPGAQAFADGGLLVAPLHSTDTPALAESLVYPMAAAAIPADAPAWVREGLPEFLRLLYLEGAAGHDRMLAELGTTLPALQQQEKDRGMDPVALATCANTLCARNKAASALLMLRGLVGDSALEQSLLAALHPSVETDETALPQGPASARLASTRRFEAALQQASGKDLKWFFRDWIDTDSGLPDLVIVQVAPRRIERGVNTITAPRERRPVAGPIGAEPEAEADDPRRVSPTAASRNTAGMPDGSWMVAVEVQNNGDAAAEVPVIVRASGLQNQLPLRIAAHSRATIRVPFETTPEEVWVNDGITPEQRSVTHHRSITFSTQQH